MILRQFGWFQLQSGEYAQARGHFQEVLDIARDRGSETLAAGALHSLARVADMEGDFPKATALAEESVDSAGKSGSKGAIRTAKWQLGYITLHNGDTRGARKHIEEALAIAREIGSASYGSENLSLLGDLEEAEGNYAKARELYEDQMKTTIAEFPRAQVLRKLGVVAMHEGDLTRASSLHREALETYARLGLKRLVPMSLEAVSRVAVASRDFGRAAKLFGAAGTMREALRAPVWPPERAEYAALRTALDDAAFEADIATGKEMSYEEAIAYALEE